MADQLLIALVTILALTAGAFGWSLLKRFEEDRDLPRHPEQLREAAGKISEWIALGKSRGLVDGSGSVVCDDMDKLDRWVKGAPFTDVVHGETLAAGERDRLDRQFRRVFAYLVVLALGSAALLFAVSRSQEPSRIAVCLLGGLFGSTVAAFRSCLDRRANGLEDRWGNRAPEPSVAKERFSDGMIRWFVGRPLLGAAVGFLLFFPLEGGVFPDAVGREVSPGRVDRLAFYMILAGLFAKTLLDLFLDVVKKVFGK